MVYVIFTGNMESIVQDILWVQQWNSVSPEECHSEADSDSGDKIRPHCL